MRANFISLIENFSINLFTLYVYALVFNKFNLVICLFETNFIERHSVFFPIIINDLIVYINYFITY